MFTDVVRRYYPQLHNVQFIQRYPDLFPFDAEGKPVGDHIATLLTMRLDPSLAPSGLTLRDLGPAQAVGESRFMMNLYLAERGDANIETYTDLIDKAQHFSDPPFASRKRQLENQNSVMTLDTAVRLQRRLVVQQMVLQAMAEMKLDTLVYPTGNVPPPKLGSPNEPNINGRGATWSFIGQQGFPAITVPAGFTTHVCDRIRDPNAKHPPGTTSSGGGANQPPEPSRLVGPMPAKLPVGVDFAARPFAEPLLFRIASAYQKATKHRVPPAVRCGMIRDPARARTIHDLRDREILSSCPRLLRSDALGETASHEKRFRRARL